MDEFSIETRMRQVVYELSQPLMIRLSDCLRQIDEQQLSIDNLKQQIRQQNESQQSNQLDAAKRYTEIDILLKSQRILELEIIKNQHQAQQSSAQLKSKIEFMEKEVEQQKSHSQFVINSQLKTQNDFEQLKKKQTEYAETFSKKIDEFFKDYFTFFVDCRNQVSQISKSQQMLLKDVQNQSVQLEQLGIHKDLQEKKQSSLDLRVEWIVKEMNHLINEDFFKFTLDKEEQSRAEDNRLLKGTIQNLQSQIEVNNVSIDERIKGLETLEQQNRQQGNSFQQQLNNQTENFQKHFKEISKELQDYNKTLNTIDEFRKKIQEKIPTIVNSHLAVFQININSQMNKLSDQFNSLKATIAKEMSQEFNYKLDDIRSQLLTESLKQQSIKLAAFESQMLEQKKKQQKKDVELQVIISDNSLSQQEQLQNFIIEQIGIKLTNWSQIGQKVGRINSMATKGGYNLTQLGQVDNYEFLDENLEDVKASVKQILLDMKDEMEQKLKEYETSITTAMQNFDKNHYHVLKLKSDIFNDTEYLNNQIKILFREKDVINRKFQLLLQLFSGSTEVAQITAAYLLKQSKDQIKFTSTTGTVFELRNEICNYRQINYSIEDLLKKSLQSVIDCWDKSELLETREYNPHWYFNKYIHKNLVGQSKTLDQSQEKTNIYTTQTQADCEVYVNRSGRQRNLSQRHSILMSLDSTRPKRVGANSVMKQSERDDSNERLPKVKK
ncbi:unnamed protein product (macronuclear) [Paramecium tetraurelia]|uniref:Uncharacterized protein n=1 Tax=Paramecium tetraurelia TaxID=5888 RepID=A0DEX2_PARTE|nr:uncharacterized protein GSPATT00016415001 [Paramecium tetraurelia]CAK81589.1 unnamed protein product [Paramecium tetraurelia]|eukprot:XP_001448986.1 hypothetical protein (macronuclear) [Paramecium tetraurelia strain d4-2]